MSEKVEIYIGSDSDLSVMRLTADLLKAMGIDFNFYILSAHRTTEKALETVATAEARGVKVIIAAAGKAAHLPGVLSAATLLPVIGVPMVTSDLGGVDSLYSIVQMPSGIPVATVAIGKAGAKNAAVLAARILALNDDAVRDRLAAYVEQMKQDVLKKNSDLSELGYEEYLNRMQ